MKPRVYHTLTPLLSDDGTVFCCGLHTHLKFIRLDLQKGSGLLTLSSSALYCSNEVKHQTAPYFTHLEICSLPWDVGIHSYHVNYQPDLSLRLQKKPKLHLRRRRGQRDVYQFFPSITFHFMCFCPFWHLQLKCWKYVINSLFQFQCAGPRGLTLVPMK